MTLQNRVTPFGDICAIPERGMFMGNRGIIHDPASRTLLSRRWATKAWIICRCDFKGIRRKVMETRSWTELFFLDEATALAAGHRPCFYCRRADAEAFRGAWVQGNGGREPKAREFDETLHRERLRGRGKRLHALPMPIRRLPDGAMVASAGASFLIVGGRILQWSPAGYCRGPEQLSDPMLLTPPSTLAALSAGYAAVLHPTAFSAGRQ